MPTSQQNSEERVQIRDDTPGRLMEVVVVHTSIEGTLDALQTAAVLALGLRARVRVLVPEVLSYAVPLSQPPVAANFLERRFQSMADGMPVETCVDIRLCRDRMEVLAASLEPHSLVVVSSRVTWWPTTENRLVRHLRRLGHQVVISTVS
jgi:hypothetical protein